MARNAIARIYVRTSYRYLASHYSLADRELAGKVFDDGSVAGCSLKFDKFQSSSLSLSGLS